MKYSLQFNTIFLAIVTLVGCATPTHDVGSHSTPDPAEIDTLATSDLTVDDQETIQPAVGTEHDIDAITIPVPDTPPVIDPQTEDLWQRIRDGFQLDHAVAQSRVQSELAWFVRHPDYLDRVATRATRHLHYIVEAVEARGMPLEIALLPIVESAFDPFAYSHGRAAGLWQFIPGTARRFGLDIDYWYDGRRDVVEATRAALDYLDVLHDFLGEDWLLALAAYNSGEGNVRRSVRLNERAGRPVDFWSLNLLKETERYVPRLLAISHLIADPGAHGITLKSIPNEPYWHVADTGGQIDLAKVAELADISTEELYLLNPGFNKWSTRPEGPHRILLPLGKANRVGEALARLPAERRLTWLRHKINSGESLGQIAQRYGTTVATLKAANSLRGNMIRAGDSLLVPTASASASAYDLSDTERLKSRQTYLQQRTGTAPVIHQVRSGDSFWLLSRRYGVSMREIARWNGMGTTDTLFPGQTLKLFLPPTLAIASIEPPRSPGIIRRVNYRVRSGESLSLIANKFNVSVAEIQQWNTRVARQKYLQPGDRITLFVDVTNTN